MLASFGYAQIQVISKPRVAIFSSGNELVQPGQPLSPGKIYDSNQFMLTGLLSDAGALVLDLETARDDPQDIFNHLTDQTSHQPDLIVSSAGVA